MPGSASKILSPTEEGHHALYDVSKIERYFGLSFDSREDLKEHVKWNMDRARAKAAGEDVSDTNHENG